MGSSAATGQYGSGGALENNDLRFVNETLQIDLDGDQNFILDFDMEIHLAGVTKVTYDATADYILLS